MTKLMSVIITPSQFFSPGGPVFQVLFHYAARRVTLSTCHRLLGVAMVPVSLLH